MSKKPRLELTWIGKDVRPKLEPRILLEYPTKSYHAPHRVTDKDIFDNMLIHGDNLLALKALEQDFTGKVKCIYIDPPFNTQQAFEHYDDGIEHSLWLSLIEQRLRILYKLLSEDGTIFIHIDDNELGYLIVLLDEIFGRKNRISIIPFKQSAASGPKSINPGIVTTTSFVLYYVKNKVLWFPNKVWAASTRDSRYTKFIVNAEKNHDKWIFSTLKQEFLKSYSLKAWADAKTKFADNLEEKIHKFVLNNASAIARTARVSSNDVNVEARTALEKSKSNPDKVFVSTREEKDDYFFINGEQIIFYKNKTKIIDGVLTTASPLTNIWDDLLSNNLHNEGFVTFPNGKKPESLVKRCLELASQPGDLVLDSFLGSGTTAAVAHKMGRQWIGIELGEHCTTHCIPRLQKVVNGEDQGGITKAVNWQGGGGFRFYELAPSLIKLDPWDIPVINPAFNAEMLAEAVCKLHGYRYAPSADWFWIHGEGHQNSHIFVTTQTLTTEILGYISDQVGESRSLLICCPPCPEAKVALFPNLTLSIMPNALLKRYEWDHDDYSLNVKNLPQAEPQASDPAEKTIKTGKRKKIAQSSGQTSLLDLGQGGTE